MSRQSLSVFAVLSGVLLFGPSAATEDEFAGLLDPTRPLADFTVAPAPASEGAAQGFDSPRDFVVSSILVRQGLRLAVVNAQRVGVGDVVGGARVRAIEASGVLLEVNGETHKVKLHQRVIKTPVTGRTGNDGQ